MSGIASSVGISEMQSFVPIFIEDKTYNIDWFRFGVGAEHPVLKKCTRGAIGSFRRLEKAMNKKDGSITLDKDFCQQQLQHLAKWGKIAYQEFIDVPDIGNTERASHMLAARFGDIEHMGLTPTPTFISMHVPFPWEILYQGETHQAANPEMFWGFRYAPARMLDPGRDLHRHVLKQSGPFDMLFCLHHALEYAHAQERPAIERLINIIGRFHLLGAVNCSASAQVQDGETLLKYLDQASHNMIHFACHCMPGDEEDEEDEDVDVLMLSLMSPDDPAINPHEFQLETFDFSLVHGQFTHQPLIFLNACQTAGGSNALRRIFNLPSKFVARGAAALLATACPVPDIFAAAFAKKFYEYFLDQHYTIGEALRETRLYFLKEHHNPLGLAYGLYSPAQYRVALPPMAEGLV